MGVSFKCEKNEECIDYLIQQILIEDLPCTRLCARIWYYKDEYNSDPTFYRIDIV